MDVVADELRQLAGNADVPQDPLNAPYILYVNPYTGSDVFVGGEFVGDSATTLERRISNQRLECGYTEARPFKTINRAAIEAAIITSREYFSQSPDAQIKALVTIQLSSGEHIVGNGSGVPLSDGFNQLDNVELSLDELQRFNTPDGLAGSDAPGAVILPRGCSLISLDLRKTVIRPDSLPANAIEDENPDYSNRRSIFKVTGGGYYYGLTFKDSPTNNETHHLLHCFEFAREAELDLLYQKALASFSAAGIGPSFGRTEEVEFQIVGPKPLDPIEETDTVNSASPYIYNCSIRSTFGLAGIFANGGEVRDDNGFRSMVTAQFTGVSLQRDLRCWEVYDGNEWVDLSGSVFTEADYQRYIEADPNNIRMKIRKRSFHVRAVNDSIIQEVSVFAIGQGIHHQAERGGELTVTNSNSNFGGCAALAQGFRRESQQFDSNYRVQEVRTAVDPLTLGNQVIEITLGFVATTNNALTRIDLADFLEPSIVEPDQPDILASEKYSLKENDYIWIENPNGPDYRSRLSADPFDNSGNQTRIFVKDPFETNGGNAPDSDAADLDFSLFPPLEDLRVYVRRFVDTRTVEERRFSFKISGPANNRLPVRDYVLQPFPSNLSDPEPYGRKLSAIRGSEVVQEEGQIDGVRIELTYVDRPNSRSDFDTNFRYRRGDVVRRFNKHYIARVETEGSLSDIEFNEKFAENFVHMQESYDPDGNFKNAQPILIFDKDTQREEVTAELFTLGNNIDEVNSQIISATDYIGAAQQIENFGGDPDTLLRLREKDQRDRDVSSLDWQFELRRPSNIRLFGQAWEWAGYLNYTKALPDYQRTLSPENKFTYYFTNEAGGKVFCNGFNEEGLQVSPRGLEDVSTGEVLSADNLTSPDKKINPITELNDVTVSNLKVNSYNPRSKKGDTDDEGYGIVRLYDPEKADRKGKNKDVLTFVEAEANFAKITEPSKLPFQIIHVIPQGVTPLTGEASIPYGFPTEPSGLQYADGDPFEKNVTEALAQASKIFVPAGSSILISVHGSRPGNRIEQGPLQLANGFAEVIVAGARGAVNVDGDPEPPTIRVRRGTTKNALSRTPQYTEEYSFSAGVTFADVTLDCNCNNEANTIATINGGFGLGGFNTSVIWRNPIRRVTAIATTYGRQGTFQFYNVDRPVPPSTTPIERVFEQKLVNPNDEVDLEFFGGGASGLVSQGCDVIFNFRETETGSGTAPKCIFKFDVDNRGGNTVNVMFVATGGRGGVTSGGRTLPVVDFDFSDKPFNLLDFVNEDARANQNYYGKSFRTRQTDNPVADYSMNTNSLQDFETLARSSNFILLEDGCCLDIERESANSRPAGPFGLYLALERYFANLPANAVTEPSILKHDTQRNSFIYGSDTRDISSNP
jgi:hypothetical protein